MKEIVEQLIAFRNNLVKSFPSEHLNHPVTICELADILNKIKSMIEIGHEVDRLIPKSFK